MRKNKILSPVRAIDIRRILAMRGMTSTDLADELGVAPDVVYKVTNSDDDDDFWILHEIKYSIMILAMADCSVNREVLMSIFTHDDKYEDICQIIDDVTAHHDRRNGRTAKSLAIDISEKLKEVTKDE